MDAFLEACGAAGPIRLEISGTRLGRRRRTLARPFSLLGRAADCDIRLANGQIQLHHAYFQLVDNRLACFDLGGRNSLRWDQGRPTRSGWLDPGTVLQIGPYRISRLFNDPAPADNGDPSGRDTIFPHNLRWAGGGPNVVLVFPDQNGGPVRWRMTRTVTLVGRAPGCRVRLPDDSVSWYHCGLIRTQAGVWLVDLLSQGGVSLNGAPGRYAPLLDGDEVTIGRFRMVIRYEEALRAATAASPTLVRRPLAPPTPAIPSLEPQVDLPLEAELMNTLSAVRGDLASPALIMLVEQFGRMQQQMLEQFYQSTMTLVGHLDDHYRDQMRMMRDELDQLRDLTHELVELRDQINTPAALPPSASAPAVAPTTRRPAPNGHRTSVPAQPFPPMAAPPLPKAPTTTATTPPRYPAGSDDPLVLVSRRIAEIRNEQRSRWQKILDLIRPR